MLSIIIPTLNEEKIIGSTLDRLAEQRGEFEVVVSDGGSSDRTAEEVARRNVLWIEGTAGRAVQLDRGAAAGRGEMLLFLHADTELPRGAIVELNGLERCGEPVAGGFPHRFVSGSRLIRLAALVHSLRSRLTGVYYGDQAPFVCRSLFNELGGFGNVPVLEDIDFARRLKRRARPRRMPLPVRNSARKLEQRGLLRSAVDAAYLLTCFELGRTRHLVRHPFFGDFR